MIIAGNDDVFAQLPNDDRRALALTAELEKRAKRGLYYRMFPEQGNLRRDLYRQHLQFFAMGKIHRERCFMAANRVGKTEGAGGYELVGHLTGQYRAWWPGYKFRRPVRTWAAGDTSQTVRDILQVKLLGPPGEEGTGLIPHDTIGKVTKKAHGPSDAVETVQVKHVTGGWSRLTFKSYDQKRKSFQGTEQDVILLDEEPDIGVYTECLTRTVTTGGLVMLTFTPLIGLSEVVLSFLPEGRLPDAT